MCDKYKNEFFRQHGHYSAYDLDQLYAHYYRIEECEALQVNNQGNQTSSFIRSNRNQPYTRRENYFYRGGFNNRGGRGFNQNAGGRQNNRSRQGGNRNT